MSLRNVSQLNLFEKLLKCVGGLIMFPLGLTSIQSKTVLTVYRFGKFDREFTSGFRWIAPFGHRYIVFSGTTPYSSKKLNLIDKDGNPIIVDCIVNYVIYDTQKYIETTNYFTNGIVETKMNTNIREVLTKYPFISHDKSQIDISRGGHGLTSQLVSTLSARLFGNGITIVDAIILEAKYAPEVSSFMMAKQQAQAYLDARKLIVQGAVDTATHVSEQMKNKLSEKATEKMTLNLITVLAGQTGTQPVIKM